MDQPIKLYSHRAHYQRAHRAELAEILRPFWKEEPFSASQRQKLYGVSAGDFEIVGGLSQANLAVLPMTWNHYLAVRQLDQARQFVAAARQARTPVLSYVSGDAGVTVPAGFDDVYVVRASGRRSLRRARQIAQPVFFADPWKRHPELAPPDQPPSSESRPAVGFCGQADLTLLQQAWRCVHAGWRNALYHLQLSRQEPQPFRLTARLRAEALRQLAESPLVRTAFVARRRYRGGATDTNARARTSREFYQNIAATDYTLCVRGGGNFSKRFYETLALGRIPLLVDTDCLLPFDLLLPWEDHIVRVPEAEMERLPQVVARHFANHGPAELAELRRHNRRLWEDWLSFAGFHRRLTRWLLASGN